MAANFVELPPNSTGLKMDTSELVVGVNTVERENVCIADPTTAANIAGVTASGAVKVDGSAVTQPVSGTVGLSAGQAVELLDSGGTNKATISAAGAVKVDGSAVTQPISGTVTADVGTTNGLALDVTVSAVQPRRLQDGAGTTLATVTASNALKVDGSAVTQPVSGTVTANAGTGPSTAWKVDLSATGANATAVKVDGSAVTQPVSGTVTTTPPANASTNITQLGGNAIVLDSAKVPFINGEGQKAAYSAHATITAAAGDIAVLPGSASKTIRVTRIEVSMSTTGTAAIEQIDVYKNSTADTGGTSAAMTAVPHDSNNAAASAAPLSYTAAPTLGTRVGKLRGIQFSDASATLPGANTWLWTFGAERGTQAIVLRGTAQQVAVNLGGAVATQTVTVSFEWTEE